MKKYTNKIMIAIVLVSSLLATVSCQEFLSIVPKGEKIPTTLADYEALLRDEYGCQRTEYFQASILINDQYVNENDLSYYPLYAANYNWDESADRIALNKSTEGAFYVGYGAINTFNLIIENVPSATEATEEEKMALIAQARVLRAMTYFNIVNYYSDTYVAETAASKGGIPLITSAVINAPYTQPSVQAIYDFMLEDLRLAYDYLPELGETTLHPDKPTCEAFYARLYLQMGNYEKAIEHADKALAFNDWLFDWIWFYEEYIDIIEDPEYIEYGIFSPMEYYYDENYLFRHGASDYPGPEYSISVERASRFEEGDARFAARWKYYTVGLDEFYRSNMDGYYNYGGITTVEVYLIKAECLARSGDYAGAMNILNMVRETRILPDYYQPLNATNDVQAMEYIIRTKSNEMIMTQIPFNDARRLNAEGKYPVILSKEVDGVTITLSPDSHLWTMPFPQGAINNHGNGTLTQNVSK